MNDGDPRAAEPLARQLIADVLHRWPMTASVFYRLRMACAGCDMAEFETIEEAAVTYGLQQGVLIDHLAAEIQTSKEGDS